MLLLLGILTTLTMSAADSCMWQLSSQPLSNPAMTQWQSPSSESVVGVEYLHDKNDARPIAAEGSEYSGWHGNANTYIKLHDATVWGNACYTNYTRRGVLYNETLHPQMVYPYLSADTVGGSLYGECYRFGGGYASLIDKWAWGISADYVAETGYRDIDPRPESITGNLHIKAGGAYKIRNYYIGIGGNYEHYTQSLDIDFKSESGKEKIYQLTGLGSHYKRFSGASENSFYSGNLWSISTDIYPHTGNGFSSSLSYQSGKITKSLDDLNNLPLASINISAINLSTAWINKCWGIGFYTAYSKRSGLENLFGLPVGDNYPLIATMEMYSHRNISARLTGIWQHGTCSSPFYISTRFSAAYNDDREEYDNATRLRSIRKCDINANIFLSQAFNDKWRISACADCTLSIPTSSSLILSGRNDSDRVERELIEAEKHRFDLLGNKYYEWFFMLKLNRRLTQKLTASIAANFRQTVYSANDISASKFGIFVSVIF